MNQAGPACLYQRGESVDEILKPDREMPGGITVEVKAIMEQVRLIQQLDNEDKHVIFKMIDTMLTRKKFKLL